MQPQSQVFPQQAQPVMMVPQNNDMSNMYYVSFMNNETGTICMQPMILQDGQFIPVVIVF